MLDKLPEETKGDYAHALVKSGIASIPFVGGPAAELFQLVIAPPLVRRRDEWLNAIAADLEEMQRDSVKLEDLAQNEVFITTVCHATQIALRTHQEEKLQALRNAVVNAAIPGNPSEALYAFFLMTVDSITEWHLLLLKVLDDPTAWFNNRNRPFPRYKGGLSSLLLDAFDDREKPPEFKAFLSQIAKDLFTRGLSYTESINIIMTQDGLKTSRTTDLGKRFLAFISRFANGSVR